MGAVTAWERLTPFYVLGLNPGAAPAEAQTAGIPGVARSSGPGVADSSVPWSPDSPLFWFGVFLAATIGLVAGSTQVRFGPFRASAGVGKT